MTAASHAASIAVSGLSYPAFVAMGIPEALALPVAIAAAGGASWAMASRERVDQWTVVALLMGARRGPGPAGWGTHDVLAARAIRPRCARGCTLCGRHAAGVGSGHQPCAATVRQAAEPSC